MSGLGGPPEDTDLQLARFGSVLADAVIEAVPGWIESCVLTRFDEWTRYSGVAGDRSEVSALAMEAGRVAAGELAAPLRELVTAGVDAQRNTPLGLVRPLVSHATAVLRAVGVPPVERDDFERSRFSNDDYRLTPVSLAALGPEVGDLALAWGAAKAMAHKRRHQ
ncbi:MAG: hypothetical protein WAM97_02290 [Acidimicrobiales bacterium]